MTNVNIKRAVENIRSGTSIYTPIVETVVNAIQAIEVRGRDGGRIDIYVHRVEQQELDGAIPAIKSFSVKDDGIGFTDENRDSFDTLYTDQKIEIGGKGFGRFTCLKYFEDLVVESVFQGDASTQKRSFKMGKETDIIVDEVITNDPDEEIGTTVKLLNVRRGDFPEKKIETLARILVEKLLPYFIDEDYECPEVGISEEDGTGRIILNNFVSNQLAASFQEILTGDRQLLLGSDGDQVLLQVRVFKIFSPKTQSSKISLVADRREVTETTMHRYVPEFVEEFYEEQVGSDGSQSRNYIVKAYVFGKYLDDNVSVERGGFEFPKESESDGDLFHSISQSDIEYAASKIARDALGDTITERQQKKHKQINEYVESLAPWHRTIVGDVDLSEVPYNPTPEQIETAFQKEKFNRETTIRRKVHEMLEETAQENLEESLPTIMQQISDTSRNDLIHYIALRKHVLSLFSKSIELSDEGKYPSEGTVHDIIFPRKGDSDKTDFENHNLWIVDERLNFTNFVSSDKTLEGGTSPRPDVLVFDTPVMFRGDNEISNPITIFEFKKPGRDDFVNPSSKEDPVQQIIRYGNAIKRGEYTNPNGRPIQVSDNTPFYGYVMCELTPKVKHWLELEKNFTPMPDGLGWFNWFGNNKLYMEVLSWDKVLRDANMRNRIFFHKLGID